MPVNTSTKTSAPAAIFRPILRIFITSVAKPQTISATMSRPPPLRISVVFISRRPARSMSVRISSTRENTETQISTILCTRDMGSFFSFMEEVLPFDGNPFLFIVP